jgi:hypothetical protein
MEKVIILAILVTLFYGIIKILEMKYIEKEWKPLKEIVRDFAYVFCCSTAAAFITFQLNGTANNFLNMLTQTTTLDTSETQVFTNAPEF